MTSSLAAGSEPSTNCVLVNVSTTTICGGGKLPQLLFASALQNIPIQATPGLAKSSEHCMSVAP